VTDPASVIQYVHTPPDTVNILIVDDEPANLLVLETVLSDPGYRIVRANSGEEALLALMATDFAVLVLDIHMPGMTGFELAGMIKERKRTARIPIIFLTAYYGEDQHVLAGYNSGAVDYLHKPLNPTVLQTKVAVFAELHRKTLALEAANRALRAEVMERRRAEASLNELNESLDQRVTERTTALQCSEALLVDANRRKDEFLATLAHELRNPLAPVSNAVHLLRLKGPEPEVLSRTCDVIDRQLRSMTRMIDDLMDVSRINQGRIELQRERIQIGAVVQEAVEASMPFIEQCGHELTVGLPEEALVVFADRTRLAQAFMNLLNNSAKYMDRGGRVELSVSREGDEVLVSCRDNGIGIPADKLVAVFDMFSQVESALSRSRGGLGIGLSLTQQLVQLHGGTVVAHSGGLGAGSEFVVRLPLEPGGNEFNPDEAPLVMRAAGPGRGLNILVADDNEDVRTSLALLLEELGHEVRCVSDGKSAVQSAAEFRPDLVLLDIGMPGMNGYEACTLMRLQPGGVAMNIVAVTGWGQPADVRRSENAGFDRHFVKPIKLDTLMDLISELKPSLKG
jgi:signal transduction histidine kinase